MVGPNVAQFLKTRVALFGDFPDERLGQLVAGSRRATFEANEAIIEFGEEGQFMGILLDGQAEASVMDDAGQRLLLGVLKAGDVFGEMALMTGDKTRADVIGTTRCEVLLIPQALFTSVIITHPPAIRFISKLISDRLRTVSYDQKSESLARSAFRKRDDPYGLKLRTDEPARILVINCGSSSLKYNLFDTADESNNARGLIERIGEGEMSLTHRSTAGQVTRPLPAGTHREAFAAMVEALTSGDKPAVKSLNQVTAVGHRVVHGGQLFAESVVITDQVIGSLSSIAGLAPLHNPINVLGIEEARRLLPRVPHVAVFDTAFHHTMPPYAYLYGLPYEYYEKKGIRRYGFHGMSHFYVALRTAEYLKRPFNEIELVSCHLGNGASVCAVDHGRSVDTSMGLTPAEGLIMGTRSGNLDPAMIIHLMRSENMGVEDLEKLINRQSGLKGLSGVSNDMRQIEQAAEQGNPRALLAVKSFSYQVRKYIGAYVAVMGGVDALVFTGGIGQGSAGMRSLACQGLSFMGIQVDETRNRAARGFDEISDIAADGAPVRILVVPADEERMIARETIRTLGAEFATGIIRTQTRTSVPIEVSAHHVHLSQQHVEALFGAGHQLTPEFELSQPGQFACKEKVNLIGPKGRVDRVRILGPVRKESQVEIAMTEQFKLGIQPPVRESGDLRGTPGLTLEGPSASVTIDQGVICALRHIHMPPEEALRLGVKDKAMVRVKVSGQRELIFGDVLVRVSPSYRLAMHLDTDEANAANIQEGAAGTIDAIQTRN
jgi:acetate kinase